MNCLQESSRLKRILSLDGGGIRGIFALQVLARIEELMREHRGQPGLALADEFDAFARTSTGPIIATELSWGLAVRDIEALFNDRSLPNYNLDIPLANRRRPRNATSRFAPVG